MTERTKRASRILNTVRTQYTAKPDMDLGNPKDTLIGVLLSARTKDSQVLKLYPAFKKRFPTFASLAKASPKIIEPYLSSIGLYKNKAKAIHALAVRITKVYDGMVPSTMEDLLTLPGVGRKTANCVLCYVFGLDTICVDTHVMRIAKRLGWTNASKPEVIEQDLQTLIPRRQWSDINRSFVAFGRDVCTPKPDCWRCPIAAECPYRPKAIRSTANV